MAVGERILLCSCLLETAACSARSVPLDLLNRLGGPSASPGRNGCSKLLTERSDLSDLQLEDCGDAELDICETLFVTDAVYTMSPRGQYLTRSVLIECVLRPRLFGPDVCRRGAANVCDAVSSQDAPSAPPFTPPATPPSTPTPPSAPPEHTPSPLSPAPSTPPPATPPYPPPMAPPTSGDSSHSSYDYDFWVNHG